MDVPFDERPSARSLFSMEKTRNNRILTKVNAAFHGLCKKDREETADAMLKFKRLAEEYAGGQMRYTGLTRRYANGAIGYEIRCKCCGGLYWYVSGMPSPYCEDCFR